MIYQIIGELLASSAISREQPELAVIPVILCHDAYGVLEVDCWLRARYASAICIPAQSLQP